MGASLAQRMGVLFGLGYVALGVVGFVVTGFGNLTQETGTLAGIGLTPFHNIAHIGIGALLYVMSTQRNVAAGEGAVMGVGLFLVVAFVIGVVGSENLSILGIDGADDVANLLHLVSGGALLAIGLMSSTATAADMKRRGLA